MIPAYQRQLGTISGLVNAFSGLSAQLDINVFRLEEGILSGASFCEKNSFGSIKYRNVYSMFQPFFIQHCWRLSARAEAVLW